MKCFFELDISSLSLSDMETLLPELIGEIAKRKALLAQVDNVFSVRELTELSKIDLIKTYRLRNNGCTLRDAKDMIDAYFTSVRNNKIK